MSGDTGTHDLYGDTVGDVVVWVEDELTEAYLNRLWNDIEIRISVAGCGSTVEAATTDARKAGLKFVFGVRDRDFGKTNFKQWTKYEQNIEVFRLPRHETENYLLDWRALAGCRGNRRGRSAQDIEAELIEHAARLQWWFATKRTLFDLSAKLSRGFPRGPGQTKIKDDREALKYILTCRGWYRHVSELPTTSINEANIRRLLMKHHERVHKALSTKEWIEVFPGKELMRKARSFIGHPKGKGSKTDADIDLAKAIAEWQVEKSKQPPDLIALRDSLRQRVFSSS